MDSVIQSVELIDSLRIRYKEYLKPNFTSICLYQTKEVVGLQTREVEIISGGLEKETVRDTTLDFIVDDEDETGENGEIKLFFSPDNPIEVNIDKLLNDYSPYSIIMTLDLFTNEAADKINRKWNIFEVDK